jgi:prepilin-type N-terminal cleavage/methylation domain-containing protein
MTFVSSRARRGFTLIELLVVIAIIGILSSVVLASLNTARSKGNYAAVKSNLATIQTQAELYYDSNGNAYGSNSSAVATSTSCTDSTLANTMFVKDATINGAIKAAANAGATMTCGMLANGAGYSVQAANTTFGNWCINNTGVATTSVGTGGC